MQSPIYHLGKFLLPQAAIRGVEDHRRRIPISHAHDSIRDSNRHARAGRIWPRVAFMVLCIVCLLQGNTLLAAEGASDPGPMKAIPIAQVIMFFFLMLGPIKIIGPFANATQTADTMLARRIAFRAFFFSSAALLLAALMGESFLAKYSIPLPVLAIAGGVILFLVAHRGILQQFRPPPQREGAAVAPTLKIAMTPIAFPTIVTPYGIAALIIFLALSPDMKGKMAIVTVLLGIMLLNMVVMLLARHILRFMGVFLEILGAVLGIIQVALGLEIILVNLKRVWF